MIITIIVGAIIAVPASFYTYVWAERKLRMRANAREINRFLKHIGI